MKYFLNLFCLLSAVIFIEACGAHGGSSGTGSTTATFTKSTALSFTNTSTTPSLLFGKFTTDSYPDMVFVSNLGADFYKNTNGSSWATKVNLDSTGFTVGVAANLNTDSNSLLDLVLYNSSQLYTILNGGASGGSFGSLSAGLALVANPAQSLAYAPKSTAGAGFVIVASSGAQQSWVSQSSGTLSGETAAAGSNVGLAESGVRVLAGDINGDGKNDFVFIPKTGSNPIEVWTNSADTSFVLSTPITTASANAIQDAALVDLNGDGKLDIVLATNSGLNLYLNSSSSSVSFTTSTALSGFTGNFKSMVVADFTGDGKQDIFLGKSSSTGSLLTQSGTLSFRDITSTAFSNDLASAPLHVYAVDLNADGKLDLVELSSTGVVTVHLNNGG
jgi:hypothetical protein